MLLNEDYFKDIEDDDIIISDDINVINDLTLEDFNTKNTSEFDQTIMFHIQYGDQSEIILSKTAYMLIQLLELYNIQHSDVCYFGDVYSNNIMNISIEKHKNYVTFSNMSNKCNANYAYAYIYIKKPIFSNIKQAVHFIYRLLNISFNDNKNLLKIGQVKFINCVNEIFNISTLRFNLYFIKDEYYDIIEVFDNLLNQSAKNFVLTDNSLIAIIRWFFGRKTVNNFFNKIKNNKKYDFKPVDNDNPFAVGRL